LSLAERNLKGEHEKNQNSLSHNVIILQDRRKSLGLTEAN